MPSAGQSIRAAAGRCTRAELARAGRHLAALGQRLGHVVVQPGVRQRGHVHVRVRGGEEVLLPGQRVDLGQPGPRGRAGPPGLRAGAGRRAADPVGVGHQRRAGQQARVDGPGQARRPPRPGWCRRRAARRAGRCWPGWWPGRRSAANGRPPARADRSAARSRPPVPGGSARPPWRCPARTAGTCTRRPAAARRVELGGQRVHAEAAGEAQRGDRHGDRPLPGRAGPERAASWSTAPVTGLSICSSPAA